MELEIKECTSLPAFKFTTNTVASSSHSNNTALPAKRSISFAYPVSLSGIGGIFASYVYMQSEAPRSRTGFGMSVSFAAAGIVAVVGLDLAHLRVNQKRGEVDEHEAREKHFDDELAELGDRSLFSEYTL